MCEITLSPCPFCGGAATESLFEKPGGGFGPDPEDIFSVGCQPCAVRFVVSDWPGHVTEDQKAAVRAKWNHRSPVEGRDPITIRKPTTRQEVEWLAKIAHLLVKDVNQTLDELLASSEQKDPS